MKIRILAIAAICATVVSCNSGKNQIPDGWVIKNEVKDLETIDLQEIAEIIDVKPIVSDEPMDEISYLNGINNDFIAVNNRCRTFYHIRDGKLVDKLNTVGNGPNEYQELSKFSYLPANNLFYGYDRRGRIMCFQTSPFKFVSKSDINYHPYSLIAIGRDQLLITSQPPIEECKDVEVQSVPGISGALMRKIKDSSAVYSFDGHSLTKLFCMVIPGEDFAFTRSDNDVLMTLLMPQHTLCRYAGGKVEKILTIDYGKMERPEPQIKAEKQNGDLLAINIVFEGDYSIGCYFPQLKGSTLAYWHRTVLSKKEHHCLSIATPNNLHVYTLSIGGLNINVSPDMLDNGVYTMVIQGDWESKIDSDESLSPLGKRIIDALKQNNENPIYLQFRLKDKYLKD